MVSPSPSRDRPADAIARGSAGGGWLIWFPLGLSSLLLVLFVVVVGRQQEQAGRIAELLQRVENLEQSRALERTAVLEQQLRSMVARLQTLERSGQRETDLERQVQSLRQELQLLSRLRQRPDDLPLETPLPAPGPDRRVAPVTPFSP